MKPGLAELSMWNPGALATAAAGATDIRAQLDRTASDTEQSASWTRRGWDSVAADTAFAYIGSAQAEASRIAIVCGELEAALLTAQTSISQARTDALEAATTARGEGFDVTDSGVVAPSASQLVSAGDSDTERSQLQARARALTTQIQNALNAVDAADREARSAIDSLCSRMYTDSSVPGPVSMGSLAPLSPLAATGSSDPGVHGPDWEVDWGIDPKTTAAAAVINGNVDAMQIGAVSAMKDTPDPALKKIFGDIGKLGVSRAGAIGAVGGTIPSIKSNLNSGIDPITAVGSEVAGAGAGLLAGAKVGTAIGGMIGGPIGLAAGFAVGSVIGAGVGHVTSRLVQEGSRGLQHG